MTVTEPTGGLRARLIRDSFEKMLRDAMTTRGWFDSGRRHQPIVLTTGSYDWDEPIPLNTLTISPEDVGWDEIELGSLASEDRWTTYIDFYSESEALGIDVSRDIFDMLRGKLADAGRTGPNFAVYDFTQEDPPVIFSCDLEDIVVDRARGFTRPHERYWFSIRVDIVDEHFAE